MLYGIKVRLTTNLTNYHGGLVRGVEGITVPPSGLHSRKSSQFVSVQFPDIGMFDVACEGLKVVDTEYLARKAETERKESEALKSATNVVKTVKPNGTLVSLRYEYTSADGNRSVVGVTNRREMFKLTQFFKRHRIEVKQEVEPYKPRERKS